MPNNGAWNGVDTGSRGNYVIVRKFRSKKEFTDKCKAVFKDGANSWMYDFQDGWTARVTGTIVNAKYANAEQKKSNGFRGYEWMVSEILEFGRIKTRPERIAEKQAKELQTV